MNHYIQIIRPSVCVLSILGIIVGGIVTGVIFNPLIILAAIAAFLITGAGNVINDYFDFEIDKTNAPSRPIPSGRMERKRALQYFLLINIIGLAISFLVNWQFFVIAIVNTIVLYVYSWKFKKALLIGNIAVSWLAASTFIAAGLISQSLPISIIVLSLISFLGTLSREIVKDIEDVKGDRQYKAKTLPIVIGEHKSEIIASIVLLVAVISLFVPITLFSNFYFIGMVPAVVVCIAAIIYIKNAHKSQKLIKFAMYFVFLGFILGSVL
ncbi:MAG: UbiA family prenyltransferase [Candidatus Aenigmatarchaeota archaeon]